MLREHLPRGGVRHWIRAPFSSPDGAPGTRGHSPRAFTRSRHQEPCPGHAVEPLGQPLPAGGPERDRIRQGPGLPLHRERALGPQRLEPPQQDIRTGSAIEELQRRDAVGSPAARELLARQEEAMNAASSALKARHERNDVVFDSMERLLNMQVEQTANMQRAMSDLLQHLISQPRGHFSMSDSVLVQERDGGPAASETFAELNEWLSREAASSP